MIEHEINPQEPVGKKSIRLRFIFAAAAVLTLTAAGAFLWVMYNRVQDLQVRLGGMEQRAASAEMDALKKAHELNSVQRELITTQKRALQAEHRTYELEATNRASESQMQQMRETSETAEAAAERAAKEAEQALQEKQQALASRQKALTELDRIRQKRAEELDRMQQALNRVAPTARTPTGMVMQLGNDSFKFDFDSAALRPENREMLSRIAGVLLASEGYRLFIDGHTDDIGTDAYNKGLSERRAASVRDYLVKAGIPAGIISTSGFGKSNPLVNARTRDAREKNRRVEIGIVDTIINYQTDVAAKNP